MRRKGLGEKAPVDVRIATEEKEKILKGSRTATLPNPYQESKKERGVDFLSRNMHKTLGNFSKVISRLCLPLAACICLLQRYEIFAPTQRIVLIPVHEKIPRQLRSENRGIRSATQDDLAILFPHLTRSPNYLGYGRFYPQPSIDQNLEFARRAKKRDYGGLENLRFPVEEGQPRSIWDTQFDRQGFSSTDDSDSDDDYRPSYYAFDDDELRSPYQAWDDDEIMLSTRCRRVSWYRDQRPTCNTMHELDVAKAIDRFIGEGTFREVFAAHYNYLNFTEPVAFKETKGRRRLGYVDMENIRIDALIAEKFTSNERFVDMYSYCGFSQVTELFSEGDIEDSFVWFQDHDTTFDPLSEEVLLPRNRFTPTEKLRLALEMVEPLVAMHTAKDAVIVHDDIDLGQYLWVDEDRLKIVLNDFNRAEIMLFDELNNEFCSYRNGEGGGYWRAPEEYMDKPLTEKIDVWSVGNNIYSLLTGLFPYFHIDDLEEIQEAIVRGGLPIIDPRYRENSFAESKLVEVIELCHRFSSDDRPSMAQVQQMLEDAIQEDQQRKKAEELID